MDNLGNLYFRICSVVIIPQRQIVQKGKSKPAAARERLSIFSGQGNRIESNDPAENVTKELDAERASTSTAVSAVETKTAPVLQEIFYP